MLELKITDGVLGVRPPVTKPHPGFYFQVGEERFRKLVDDHYENHVQTRLYLPSNSS